MSENVLKKPQQWMIKDKEGQISGPHSTQEVVHLIHTGSLIGAEKVSEYPSGLWKVLSQYPQFYDALFFALANKKRLQKSAHQSKMDHSNTEHLDQKAQDQSLIISKNLPEDPMESKDHTYVLPSESKKVVRDKSSQDVLIESVASDDIVSDPNKSVLSEHLSNEDTLDQDIFNDLDDDLLKNRRGLSLQNQGPIPYPKPVQNNVSLSPFVKPSQKKEKRASSRKPKILFLLFFIFMSYLLFWDESLEDQQEESIVLIAPDKFNIGQISQADIRNRFQKNLRLFYKSTYHDYVEVQRQLVSLAEQASDVPEILGLLCLTHRELWPYSQKTTQDQEAISRLSQRMSKVQAIGIHQDICNVVKYLLLDQIKIAMDVINKSLKDYDVPVLYDLKAEILAKDGKYNEAIAYIQIAQKTHTSWKSWLKLYIKEAEYNIADKKFVRAAHILRQLNSRFPSHALTLILLGYLNLKELDNHEKGIKQIHQGLQSNEVFLSAIYSKVTLALARYYQDQQNEKMALEFAKQSYQKSSINRSAKEMIVELGGPKALQAIQTTDRQLINLGNMLFEKGMFVEAQAHYKAAYEQNRNAIAAMKAGQCLWELNLTQDSIDWLRKAIISDHKLTEAYVILSDYLSQKYHFDAAIRVLLRAMKKVPQNHEIFRSMALVELRRNNYKGAESFVKKAHKLHDTDIKTNILLSQILYKMGKYQEAYHAIAKTLEISGEYHVQVQGIYGKILAALQGEDFGVNHLKGKIHTYPNVVDYQIALAEIYLFHQKYSKAEQILTRAVATHSKNKKIRILLGEMYSKMTDHDEALNKALKAYLEAAIIDPIDAAPLFQVGLLYMRARKYKEAIAQFQRVLKINEKYPKAHFYRGTAYLKLGKSNQALAEAKKEKQINPSLAEPYLLAGDVYMKTFNYNKAILEFQKAIKIRPQGGQIYISLAKAYRLSNNFDVAEKMIMQAQKLENGNPTIYKEQGEIYESRGEIRRAIAVYERYIQLSPNAYDKQAIKSKISQLSRQ